MTREELIDELNNRIGFETDNERYAMSESEKEFYRDILNVLEQEPTKEEQALLKKWRDNRGVSIEDFEEAMDELQEPFKGNEER